MIHPDPAKALSGARTGHICSGCNKGLRTGDLVRAYATFYEGDGWMLRRIWCDECDDGEIRRGTKGADEVSIKAVFWNYRLAAVKITDRSPATDGGSV